jgi:hypothetical protein
LAHLRRPAVQEAGVIPALMTGWALIALLDANAD